VVASGLDSRGLPKELTDPKSVLSQRSIYFDLDKYEVKDEYKDLVASHAKYLVSPTKASRSCFRVIPTSAVAASTTSHWARNVLKPSSVH
jgi:hypothetical protein